MNHTETPAIDTADGWAQYEQFARELRNDGAWPYVAGFALLVAAIVYVLLGRLA